MDNRDILVDTSVIIDFLRKKDKKRSHLWRIKELDFNCLISTITAFELYAGAVSDIHKRDLQNLIKWMTVLPFTLQTAQISGDIYRELKVRNELIEFRDIFIGATAVELAVPVLTLNEKHFKRIKGVDLYSLTK